MTKNTSERPPRRAWWREPMMWLVLGGPLLVVAASFVTLVLALKHPDPVLVMDTGADGRSEAPAQARDAALVPALQARNHAATGGR
jgi:hypothetical protein